MVLLLGMILINVYKKNWLLVPKYHKSLAYVSFINAMYYYLFKRHLLWEFNPGESNWRFVRATHMIFLSPLLVLLFFSGFPATNGKRIVYTMKYVLLSTLAEHLIAKRRMIFYKNGWNVLWSGIIYFQMFVFSYLLLKRPTLTWILSLFSILFYIKRFKLPLTRRLLKGPFFFFIKTKPSFLERIKIVLEGRFFNRMAS